MVSCSVARTVVFCTTYLCLCFGPTVVETRVILDERSGQLDTDDIQQNDESGNIVWRINSTNDSNQGAMADRFLQHQLHSNARFDSFIDAVKERIRDLKTTCSYPIVDAMPKEIRKLCFTFTHLIKTYLNNGLARSPQAEKRSRLSINGALDSLSGMLQSQARRHNGMSRQALFSKILSIG